jgi:hypothetical protein
MSSWCWGSVAEPELEEVEVVVWGVVAEELEGVGESGVA